jgi:hypothetical protein
MLSDQLTPTEKTAAGRLLDNAAVGVCKGEGVIAGLPVLAATVVVSAVWATRRVSDDWVRAGVGVGVAPLIKTEHAVNVTVHRVGQQPEGCYQVHAILGANAGNQVARKGVRRARLLSFSTGIIV